MKAKIHTLAYALILGTVCACLLTGVGRFTRPRREINKKVEKAQNVLRVLEVAVSEGQGAQEIIGLYDQSVEVKASSELTIYLLKQGTQASADGPSMAVEVTGPGLWGPMRGLLSLGQDKRTIRGISFYEQEETPGLGGEIGTDAFQNQFKGKKIVDENGNPGMKIVRGGGSTGIHEVDGISGATMTCDKVEEMLNQTIAKIVKEY